MRHLRLKRHRIDLQASPVIRRQTAGLQVQTVGRAHAPGCIEQHFRPNTTAIVQHRNGPVVFKLNSCYLGAKPDRHAAITQLMCEILDQFVIDEIQKAAA